MAVCYCVHTLHTIILWSVFVQVVMEMTAQGRGVLQCQHAEVTTVKLKDCED